MLIAKRYLDEIEDICNGTHAARTHTVAHNIQYAHWKGPGRRAGLFQRCAPDPELRAWSPGVHCGCLTQIRLQPDSNYYTAVNAKGARAVRLTQEIRQDTRLADTPEEIAPAHLRTLRYPLTPKQKRELRAALLPYAEWQTKLRLKFKDVPEKDLKLVEVNAPDA